MLCELLLAHVVDSLVCVHFFAEWVPAHAASEDIFVPEGRADSVEEITDVVGLPIVSIDHERLIEHL